MENKFVELGVKGNFIQVNIINESGEVLYNLKNTKGDTEAYRFNNFNIARFWTNKILKNRKVQYVIHLNDGSIIDLANCQKVHEYFQYYDLENDTKYFIKEKVLYQIHRVGYICFEKGDEVRCSKEYGIRRQRELFKWMIGIIDSYMSKNEAVGIVRKERISGREYILYVKDSTARIHILANSELMDLNQERKEKGIRCIPFIRSMDKFLTISVFVDKDAQEKIYFDSETKVEDILKDIIRYMVMDLKGNMINKVAPHWVEVPFSGFITIEE